MAADEHIDEGSASRLDEATAPREGEVLDRAGLERYLRGRVPGAAGSLAIEQFPSGHSNLTYLLRMGDEEWVLRRPPFGAQAKGGHNMSREYRVLSRLHPVYPPAPEPILFCDDPDVIGTDFYVMRRVRGVILRVQPPTGVDMGPDVMRRLSESFVDNLATIHTIDWRGVGLGDLGRPKGYVERQIRGWIERYEAAKTDEIPEMEDLAQWLVEDIPVERGAALIHNDYKYDNVVLDQKDLTRIVGVLDWEMATVGDPVMDLGSTLGYWVEARDTPEMLAGSMGPTQLPGNLSRREIAVRYGERTGFDVSDLEYYYVYALFKLAVILQQIYFRFARGFTDDARFGPIGERVAMLARTATAVLENPNRL